MSAGSPRATRRQFLVGVAGVAAAGALARIPVAGAATTRGLALTEPPVLRSAAGLLEVTLRAAAVQLPWAGGTRYALAYNGSVPGPTLRVRPGDRLVVHLENGLDRGNNLHTHGLHVSPAADDVFTVIPAGGTRTYVYDIPAAHPPGLFWYHPHVHGYVAEDVAGGLAGMIVVDDPDPAALPPELTAATERLVMLSDPPIGTTARTGTITAREQMAGREGDVVLVNGVHAPRVGAAAGTVERWRIVNASASRFYRLALDGHPLVRIGSDQGLFTKPETRDDLLLAPAERADLLIVPTTAGRYRLRSLAYDRGRPQGGAGSGRSAPVVLATMDVTGTAPAAAIPTVLPGRPPTVPPADTTRLVDLAMAMVGTEGVTSMDDMPHGPHGMTDVFTINGKTFDPARIDVAPPLGSTQEWVIRNATTMDHPIHLHTWPFVITRRSDDVPIEPGWKDTVNVPAGEEVRIRIPFVDHAGLSIYHCHILDHEDMGMMATVEVR